MDLELLGSLWCDIEPLLRSADRRVGHEMFRAAEARLAAHIAELLGACANTAARRAMSAVA